MATWTYLVTHDSGRVGNAIVTRSRPIDSADEVYDVQAWLRRNGVAGAILTNVVLLKRRRFAKWKDRGTLIVQDA